TKTVNLALQGGGAHGAFTWGVLDRLLDEETLEFEAITGTSAGAMNAAALKTGLVTGGSREAGRKALDDFWGDIGRMGRGPAPNPLLEWVRAFDPSTERLAEAIEANPAWHATDTLSRMFSPYDLNPFNLNPLRRLLADKLDFDAVCQLTAPLLFIGATNVRTGKIKVFEGDEIGTEAILASACLPTLFQAVEIEDPKTGRKEAYWDGGYTGNPALFPIFQRAASSDVIIVHINPLERDEVPRTSRDILNRLNEISFNSSLLRELRAIDFVRRLIEDGRLGSNEMKRILVHSIRDDRTMRKLGHATKVQADWTLLQNLKSAGREAADAWLRAHWKDIGKRNSVDLREMFG
ncbi:MAG: patatin-like phospholipase family protein, partial [Pseudomonadota bacterium]